MQGLTGKVKAETVTEVLVHIRCKVCLGLFLVDKDISTWAKLTYLQHTSPGGFILPVCMPLINAIKNYCSKQDENMPL